MGNIQEKVEEMNNRFNLRTEKGIWNIFYLGMAWAFISTLPIIMFGTMSAEVITIVLVSAAILLESATMYKLKKLKFRRKASGPYVRLFRK